MSRSVRNFLGFGFNDKQSRGIIGLFLGAVVVLLGLLIANAAVWLLSGLWNVSVTSPFGPWGFAGSVALALLIGGLTVYYIGYAGPPRPKPFAVSDSCQTEIKRLRADLSNDATNVGAAERRRWEEPQAPTPDVLKTQINEIMKVANASRDAASIEKVERLMETLQAADPSHVSWLNNQRWILDKLKVRP
jgi:hypothetical protein